MAIRGNSQYTAHPKAGTKVGNYRSSITKLHAFNKECMWLYQVNILQ